MTEDLLRRFDHRKGLSRTLRMPNKAPCLFRIQRTLYDLINRPHLMLAEHDLSQFVIFGIEDNPFTKDFEKALPGKETLYLLLKIPFLLILPVENILPV